MFHIEPGDVVSGPSCACCSKPGRSAFGFVHRDGVPMAFYYAWLDPHRDRRVVSLALSLGEWTHDGDASTRSATALRFESSGGDVSCSFVDPVHSPYADRDVLGPFLSADEVRAGERMKAFLAVAEAVVLEDPEVNAHLMS